MRRALPSLLVAPVLLASQDGASTPARAVECRLPLAQARAAAETQPLLRRIDRTDGSADDHSTMRDPRGMIVYGLRADTFNTHFFDGDDGTEFSLSVYSAGDYASVRSRLLAAHGRRDCSNEDTGIRSCSVLVSSGPMEITATVTQGLVGVHVSCSYYE